MARNGYLDLEDPVVPYTFKVEIPVSILYYVYVGYFPLHRVLLSICTEGLDGVN